MGHSPLRAICFKIRLSAVEQPARKNRALPGRPDWKLGGIMAMHKVVPLAALLLALGTVGARGTPPQDQNQLPADYVPSGGQMFKQYCAACHGADAKGHGPARRALNIPAPDLTILAKRHGGKFPYAYVTAVLRFAPGVPSHGSGTMPMWGPLFEYYYNQSSAQRRIQNLCDYLASLQEK
jgi:mono/diheme cytochrome c family protein